MKAGQCIQQARPAATPTPTPECEDGDGDGYGSGEGCLSSDCNDSDPLLFTGCITDSGGGCPSYCISYCDPIGNCYTPILIDTAGDGLRLTSGPDGVAFDIDADPATPNRLSWTEAGSDDAWLALDRDGSGTIDSGRELFGNFTSQAPSAEPNGFLALAVFDRPARGGNSDGAIDGGDSVFTSLRLWRDTNHDGLSQTEELYTLPSLGVLRIGLDYKESKRRDAHGNVFRYRAKVGDAGESQVGRWAWDVFLVPAW